MCIVCKVFYAIISFCQVGKNLHVLSQIEGIDLEIYRDTVLPRILEQVLYVYIFVHENLCIVINSRFL